MLISFSERGKQENPEKNLAEQRTNHATTQTQLTYDFDAGIWTRWWEARALTTVSSLLDNCPIYQFRVYLEVKYFQASVIIHWQYIFLLEEEIGGLKKSQKLDQNRSPGVIKIGNVTSKTADRTQQPKAVKA